jgi:inhibitor of cysteine peptidase
MSELVITDAERNTVVSAHVGDTVVVRLQENPTTGYQWTAKLGSGILELRDDSFQSQSPAIGGGGVHQFRFVARRAGRETLQFGLGRSWEASSKSTFSVTISVLDATAATVS